MYLQVCFFLFVEEEGVTCRKREKVALKVGRPKRKTSPPFIMRCVLLWRFPTLFYTHTHTHVYMYVPSYNIYIYIYLCYLYIQTDTQTPNMVVRESPEADGSWRSCGPVGWRGTRCNHSFQSYHSSRPQTGSTYHTVTSSLYHRRRVYDDQTIGFPWQITKRSLDPFPLRPPQLDGGLLFFCAIP